MQDGFKRINFFKGFFTQAEDWQASEDYHRTKRQLHNQFLHTPGIVPGCLDELNVTVLEDGTTLQIGSGLAIDGDGRELYRRTPEQIVFNPAMYELSFSASDPPHTRVVYVVLRHEDLPIEFRPNMAHSEYEGHAFIQEGSNITVTTEMPDKYKLELARVTLSQGVTKLTNPQYARYPGPDQIDRRYIKKAGVARGRLHDIAGLILDSEADVASSETGVAREEDPDFLIERVPGRSRHCFYLASVCPLEDTETEKEDGTKTNGGIHWRIESFFRNEHTEYRLYITNFSQKDVKVSIKVYKLTE